MNDPVFPPRHRREGKQTTKKRVFRLLISIKTTRQTDTTTRAKGYQGILLPQWLMTLFTRAYAETN